jgi:hypothetical protein
MPLEVSGGIGTRFVLKGGGTRRLRVTWNKGDHPGSLRMFGLTSGGGIRLTSPGRTAETLTVTGPRIPASGRRPLVPRSPASASHFPCGPRSPTAVGSPRPLPPSC